MLRNFFTLAWRNLLKNRSLSILNIAGLAIGLASVILIALFVTNELSYDKHHENASRIYRVQSDIRFGGADINLAVSSDPTGAALKNDYADVEQFTRIYNSNGSKQIKKGNSFITEFNVAHVDSTFFEVFTVPFIQGVSSTALNEPNTVVISESVALKYFNRTNVVGETIETTESPSPLYKITGVYRDMPSTGHFKFDMMFSMDNVQYGFGNFLSHNFYTYLLLRKGTDAATFNTRFKTFVEKYVLPQAAAFMNIKSMSDFEKAGNKLEYGLMPLTKIHLHSNRFPELSPNSDIRYIYIFSAVAVFVLLLACINFINLSTANSSSRAKEIGVRKVLGAEKPRLVLQFLSESILTALFAMVLAVLLAWLCMGLFNNLAAKQLTITSLLSPAAIVFIVLLILIVGLLAGSYPAFYIAGFEAIAALKGRLKLSSSKSYLRNSLVVFQFAIAIILIVGTIVVYNQLQFIQTKNLGFKKEQVLVINSSGGLGDKASSFLNEVKQIKGVNAGSMSGYLPVSNSSRTDNTFSAEAAMNSENGFNMQNWQVDEDYIPTLGMEIIAGRNFDRSFGGDSSSMILNEAAAALIGGGNVVGKKIYQPDGNGNVQVYTVVGVIKNFHFESLRQTVSPLSLVLGNANWSMAFRIDATQPIQPLVAQIEAKFKSMANGRPFSYEFLDEAFDNMYRAEQRTGRMAMSFSVIAIFIACIGLFGLATYMARKRIKEIGVRKVLGASVSNIITMLSAEFVKLVLIASVIALPASFFIMKKWLQDFAYRTNITWWMLALAALAALSIAMLTVSYQALKAALVNPVKSLRTE